MHFLESVGSGWNKNMLERVRVSNNKHNLINFEFLNF